MALTISPKFYATRVNDECVPFPMTINVRSQGEWTPEQYGDLPDGEMDKQKQYRVRRWLAAWQATCLAYQLPLWSVWVPCNVCNGAVSAYRADPDHIVSRANGGQSEAGQLALTHPACNRILKVEKNAPANVQNAFKAIAHLVVTFAGMPNAKGGQAARDLEMVWNFYPRAEN